jgi:U2 small nuclear ribonucleoprotein B''
MLPGSEKPALVEGGAAEADKATEAFGAAPNKAVPVENKERAKGTKRGREEEADEEEEEEKEEEKKEEEKKEEKKDEEEDDESSSGAEMEMGSSDEESE